MAYMHVHDKAFHPGAHSCYKGVIGDPFRNFLIYQIAMSSKKSMIRRLAHYIVIFLLVTV